MYFWIKVVEMDEKYNESCTMGQFSDLFVLSLALSVVPATSPDVKIKTFWIIAKAELF